MIVFPLQRDSGARAAENFRLTTIRVPPHDLQRVRERNWYLGIEEIRDMPRNRGSSRD